MYNISLNVLSRCSLWYQKKILHGTLIFNIFQHQNVIIDFLFILSQSISFSLVMHCFFAIDKFYYFCLIQRHKICCSIKNIVLFVTDILCVCLCMYICLSSVSIPENVECSEMKNKVIYSICNTLIQAWHTDLKQMMEI